MNGKELLILLSEADTLLIEESEEVKDLEKKNVTKMDLIWIISIAVVAAVSLVFIIIPHLNSKNLNTNLMYHVQNSDETLSYIVGIDNLKGLEYHFANAEDRMRFGLPSDIEDVVVVRGDIGDFIGTVSSVKNKGEINIVGNKAYHYSKYPDKDSIILVDMGDSYAFFCTYGYSVDIPLGESLNKAFEQYKLPETGEKVEVYDQEGNYLKTLTEESDIRRIVEVLTDCINIGYEEQDRRLCRVWCETYGNDYVYFDEEARSIKYRDVELDEDTADYESGESAGVSIDSQKNLLPVEDMAEELWHKDSLDLVIEVKEGYRLRLNYCPVSKTITAFNGSFDLKEETIKELEQLTK